MSDAPLVSCIMPTYNRRAFVPHAISYFLRQTYSPRELIVIDDGTDPVEDLIPPDPCIRYERLSTKATLGAKLNLACELAKGDIIAHFDDDDWYAPHRLQYQLDTLLRDQTELCGINDLLYYSLQNGRAWRYRYPPGHKTWLLGSDLCYLKSFWQTHRFADINVGMDGLFSWSAAQDHISVLPDPTFAVHMIHGHNVSPKQVTGPCWYSHPPTTIEKILGADWGYYRSDSPTHRGSPTNTMRPRPRLPAEQPQPQPPQQAATVYTNTPTPVPAPAAARTLRNVFACLVHERPDCVIDLVRNLRCLDESSRIILYDGSAGGDLLDPRLPWSRWGAEIHSKPTPMKWGRLHGFALDCIRYLRSGDPFDLITVVDSDQMAVRRGYSEYLTAKLGSVEGLGVLSSEPKAQGPKTRVPPCMTAHQEFELWRPFLQRFKDGPDKFVQWTFWPATIMTAQAGFAVLDLFDHDPQLADILAQSRLWATEEILFPTLAALSGFRVEQNPCSPAYVRFRTPISLREVDTALTRRDTFWMHPVPRDYAHPVRTRIRHAHNEWQRPPTGRDRVTPTHSGLIWPLLNRMHAIEGWLSDEEAELLAVAARESAGGAPRNEPRTLVEIGSYCGKATYVLGTVAQQTNPNARVIAIDTFDGVVGALDRGPTRSGPTLAKFQRVMEESGLTSTVRAHVGRACEANLSGPLDFVLLDGLHDYASVAQDFSALEAAIPVGALIAFHDYADYFPGVRRFVDELLELPDWVEVAQAGSLKLLRRQACGSAGEFR